jgi:hypothetical protein
MFFRTIKYRTLKLAALSCCILSTSCDNEIIPSEPIGAKGTLALTLKTGEVKTETITRATLDIDVNTFRVSISESNGTPLIQDKPYATLSESDCTLPTAKGYLLSVENCTETEAITQNDGWGMPRFTATSTFDIESGKTTSVDLVCTLENTGLQLGFDPTFIDKFPIHAVTVQDSRALVFKSTNQDQIAYFNTTSENLTINVKLTGTAGGWSDRLDMTKSITLTKGKINVMKLTYSESSATARLIDISGI